MNSPTAYMDDGMTEIPMTRDEFEKLLKEAFCAGRAEKKGARAEWTAVTAIGLNIITLAVGAGIYINTIAEHGKDIAALQAARAVDHETIVEIRVALGGIHSDVKGLVERAAREDMRK